MGIFRVGEPGYPPVQIRLGNLVYEVQKQLGRGGFGEVYEAKILNANKSLKVAIKFELMEHPNGQPPEEWEVYRYLGMGDVEGVPRLYYTGKYQKYWVMVMDLLGPSLEKLLSQRPDHRFPPEDVQRIAIDCIRGFQRIHAMGFVHSDVKPDNIVMGHPDGPDRDKLFIVDFGLASRWLEENTGLHVPYAQRIHDFRGTTVFASVNCHLGRTLSRRDDLESLAYSLIEMLTGTLPWDHIRGGTAAHHSAMCKMKMEMPLEAMQQLVSAPLANFLEEMAKLNFDEEPDYDRLARFFECLCWKNNATFDRLSCPHEIESHNVVATGNPQRQKKSRYAPRVYTWMVVMEKQIDPKKQRFHLSVPDDRLGEIMDKSFKEEFHLFTASSDHNNKWTLVFKRPDPDTQQTSHVCNFMSKDWLTQHWQRGFRVTTLAGSPNGRFVVALQRSVHAVNFNNQVYHATTAFPTGFIESNRKRGYFVTSLTTYKDYWFVIMTLTDEFIEQVYEMDMNFPSEAIHRRWKEGYVITNVAADTERCCFVMSKLKGRKQVWQEVQRAEGFPIKKIHNFYWPNNFNCLCFTYGKTAKP